nr:spore coat protein U domain-containing protein [uncultured Deefgea sp.]
MAKHCLRILAALSAIFLCSTSMAAGGGSLRVSIGVMAKCKFTNSNDIKMDFGDLAYGNRSISEVIQINCVLGESYKLELNNGLHADGAQRRMKHESQSAWLPYGLNVNPSSGQGTGQNINVTLTATVAENDYQSRPIGRYNDTVILTITP